MATIQIRDQTLDIDIRAELERFNWSRPRWTSDKLIAASPFRYDRTPSFFVNLDGPYAGTWADSGYYDEDWKSGGFVKLLAFLRNETWEETEDYLLVEYGWQFDREDVKLSVPTLQVDRRRPFLDRRLLDEFPLRFDYLAGRGISEDIQRQANIRYDPTSRAVLIPWFDASKRLCNVKYRTLRGKTFWYHRGAVPVRELVYGIESVTGPTVVLCEAEIDALSCRQAGFDAIAVGGVSFTDKQADIIKRAPIETLILSGDNDKAGRKFNEQVTAKLRGHVALRQVDWPDGVKDANDALKYGSKVLHKIVTKSKKVDNFLPMSSIFVI